MEYLDNGLSINHWNIANYKQRMTTKQWKQILLNKDDELLFVHGVAYSLCAKRLGSGVVEVYKVKRK